MDSDLNNMRRSQLIESLIKLRNAVRVHRDSSAHDLCWHHPELWNFCRRNPTLDRSFQNGQCFCLASSNIVNPWIINCLARYAMVRSSPVVIRNNNSLRLNFFRMGLVQELSIMKRFPRSNNARCTAKKTVA